MNKTISIIILTLNAEEYLKKQLSMINLKKYNVLVVDSSSEDNTIKICKDFNCKYEIIKRNLFNHGATRENFRNYFNDEVVVFLTQDSIPTSNKEIDKLIYPISTGKASCSYGRQIPRFGSDIFESFPREFNYGLKSHVRSLKDIKKYGVYTFFCSNSFSAYKNKDLDLIGGFKATLTNEDYFACAGLLQKKKKVAYVAEAEVIHSHKFSLKKEFQRYFDTGYVRSENPEIQNLVGHADRRGILFLKQLIRKLVEKNIFLVPYAIIQTAVKYFGFKIGYYGYNLPDFMKIRLSNEKYYWKSKFYLNN